jgi:hypothetical protein
LGPVFLSADDEQRPAGPLGRCCELVYEVRTGVPQVAGGNMQARLAARAITDRERHPDAVNDVPFSCGERLTVFRIPLR